MGTYEVVVICLLAAALMGAMIVNFINRRKLNRIELALATRRKPMPKADPLLEEASILLNIESSGLIKRPILPNDVGKTAWNWTAFETFILPSIKIMVLDGVDSRDFLAVFVTDHHGNTRQGLLTEWTRQGSPIMIRPNQGVGLQVREAIEGEEYHYALSGYIIERNGATVYAEER